MTEYQSVHNLGGFPEERLKELDKDVITTLKEAKLMDAEIKKLAEKYEPEALLVGMCLIQLLWTMQQHKTIPHEQNANLN